MNRARNASAGQEEPVRGRVIGIGGRNGGGADRSGPRVCLLTETYHPVVGGGETQARTLSRGLSERLAPVLVLTRRSSVELGRIEQRKKVMVRRGPPAGRGQLFKWCFLPTSFFMLLRWRRDYDVVYVSGFRMLGIAAIIAGLLTGRPTILKADSLGEMSGEFFRAGLRAIGLAPTSFGVRHLIALRNRLFGRSSAFVAISSAVETELIEAGVPPAKIRRIPNSVDVRRFQAVAPEHRALLRSRLGWDERSPVAVYTGRLVSYKGLPGLVSAWADVRTAIPSARLVLVGGEGLDMHACGDRVAEIVERSGIRDAVELTGDVSDVSPYLQAADLFVFPSEREAFGISLIEAMACGLASATSTAGGLADIVADGRDGLTFPPGDIAAMVDAIVALLGDEELRRKIGAEARKSARLRFSEQAVVDETANLIHEVFGRSVSSPRPDLAPGGPS